MCGTAESTKTTSANTSTAFPDWTQGAGQSIFSNAANWLSQNPTMPIYQGQRVADFGNGFGQANNYASGQLATNPSGLSSQGQTASNALTGLVGSINPNATTQDYMDPYLAATLQPTLDNLKLGFDQGNANTAASATAAGALGDTGYGNQMALNQKNYLDQIRSTTANAYSGAFNNAQGARNTALSTLMSGSNALAGVGQTGVGNNNQLAQFLASLGSTQQQAQQGGINSQISDFNNAANYPIKQGLGLSSILSQIPKNTTGTSNGTETTSTPDNSGMSLAGSALSYLMFDPVP